MRDPGTVLTIHQGHSERVSDPSWSLIAAASPLETTIGRYMSRWWPETIVFSGQAGPYRGRAGSPSPLLSPETSSRLPNVHYFQAPPGQTPPLW